MQEGRPSVMTPKTLKKLKEAFLMGYSDREACIYAEIAPSTLYKYQEENPEFSEQKEQYKRNPVLKAKRTIFKNLKDVKIAKWYLERKAKNEFGARTELSAGQPQNTNFQPISKEEKEAVVRKIEAQIELIRKQSTG